MTILADLSRYDDDSTADDYDGVILNCEDPDVRVKAGIAYAASVPVLLYSWVYPGGGASAVVRGRELAKELGYVKGVWLDYEEAGNVPQDIRDARQTDTGAVPFGVYAYLYMLNKQGANLTDAIGDWPLWIAYYPNRNDGSYPADQVGDARAFGAVLWQYTSTNGTRDLSMVLSEPWWESWTAAPPINPPHSGDDDMIFRTDNPDAKRYYRDAAGYLVRVDDTIAYTMVQTGVRVIPIGTDLAVVAWNNSTKRQLAVASK